MSATFAGAARSKHRLRIFEIVKNGIAFAFEDAPKKLSFLEGAVLQFVPKLPVSDIMDMYIFLPEHSILFSCGDLFHS